MTRLSSLDTALVVLIILQLVMMFAMFFQAPPHPPYAVVPFAMGPFLAASLASCIAALLRGGQSTRSGQILTIIAAVLAMVSYGPQKWFDPMTHQIWPAVLTAQIAVGIIAYKLITSRSVSET
ncbi:MAG: hypothetical protein AAFR27_05090 [Pseudomonadota bacterium]